ncbi:hypothetical protein ACTJK4_12700 [Ralstonia sp. 22111]|uniref:hypothetical protein n=1 Tax=Ralstonia sp. 22111 TaxID=3453878 RepID=UPI003F874BDC
MHTTVNAIHGRVEIQAMRRDDQRWQSEFRYLPNDGPPTDWMPAYPAEGFVSEGMALGAAILLGKQIAESFATPLSPEHTQR